MSQTWQLQQAKQRFSELIRAVQTEGPQIVSRHGREVAIVIEIEDYHRMRADDDDFKEFLVAGPDFTDLEIVRDQAATPRIELE